MSSGPTSIERDPSAERRSRVVNLLAAGLAVQLFTPTDALVSGVDLAVTWPLRAVWTALFLTAAWATRAARPGFDEPIAALTGAGSVIIMGEIALATGGVGSPNFAWLVAFPFLAFVIAPDSRRGIGVTGLTTMVWGGWLLVTVGQPTRLVLLWESAMLGSTLMALYAGHRAQALRREEMRLAHAHALAEANLGLSEQRRQDVERLAHIERLATLGELSAGVGHEINNLLTGASLNLELLAGASEEEARQTISELRTALGRMRVITAGVAAAARVRDEGEGPCEVQSALREALRLTGSRWRDRGRVGEQLPAEPLYAAMDHLRLLQVFVNLILNAVDAFEATGASRGLEIVVAARALPDRIEISVADNGSGVPEPLRATIFDAFVSSKPAGKGTGLGLSICRRFLAQAGGHIALDCPESGGARFIIALPPARIA